MKKIIFSISLATTIALCVGFHSASASLIGMPLNLKVAIQPADMRVPDMTCQFYTDELLTGPMPVKSCSRS
jgi:hypothetical protein